MAFCPSYPKLPNLCALDARAIIEVVAAYVKKKHGSPRNSGRALQQGTEMELSFVPECWGCRKK